MKVTPRRLKFLLNIWPPFWGSGMRVIEVSDDWTYAKVRLRKYWFNRNFVNTHYGGSLFSMTDSFYMLLLLHLMGKDYIVWDKKAEIKFIKPGREDVFAEFRVSPEQVADFKQQLETADKVEPLFEVEVIDSDGLLISKVWKTLYIARKDRLNKK